jgi:NAD(P)-dependent dehydrogenase (short-subunit alcohol dehydrogenase family)
MNIANKTVLITGANRGIGRALVEEALRRGAKTVYAGTRGPWRHSDQRVRPLTLDVTNAVHVQKAVTQIGSLDVLINNAGILIHDDLSKPDVIEQHLAVNLFGPLNVTRAVLPLLKRSKGAVVNILSTSAIAALPSIPGYSISKAAALSMTQSLRALLAGQGVIVHAIMTGPVDTEMTRNAKFPNLLLNLSQRPSSMDLKRATKRSSRIPCPNPSPRAGATAWSSPLNARSQVSSPTSWLSR